MKAIFPEKLQKGDKIMVVSPSDSLKLMPGETRKIAEERFGKMGFQVSFAKNAEELDEFDSSRVRSRVDDVHEAFADKEVKAVFTAYGGYNCNQLLRHLDWDLIRNNPKVFIGFSDTTVLQNAIFAKAGLVTYSGPSYARFGQKLYFEYSLDYFEKCVTSTDEFDIQPSESWSDDWWLQNQEERKLVGNAGWVAINAGEATGTILGGNLNTFRLLQGTEYFPDLKDSILFLEDDSESKLVNFDRDLQSIIHLPGFSEVRGLVIGRFQNASNVKIDQLVKTLKSKEELRHIPILANVDFGHTDPIITFPIGGQAKMIVSGEKSTLRILRH